MPRVDLHCHLLPGLDDGPRTPDQAMALLDALAEAGYSTVAATPHRWAGMWRPSAEQIQEALALLRREGAARRGIDLLVGAENHLDSAFVSDLRRGTIMTIGGTSLVLLELPVVDLPPNLDDLLFQLMAEGLVPILAHPERYPDLAKDRLRLGSLRDRGVVLQVSLTSIGGKHGWWVARRAISMVKHGLADILATDAHSARDVMDHVLPAFDKVERLVGEPGLTRLTVTNPGSLLSEEK